MRHSLRVAGLAGLLLAVGTAGARAEIDAADAWSRATPPGVRVGAAYVNLTNRGRGDDRLVAASSPVADTVEIHATTDDNGVLRMREQASVEMPVGEAVGFAPGGMHFMLLDLHQPLLPDMHFPLQLQFENAGMVTVDVAVRDLVDGGMAMDHSKHMGMQGGGMAMDHSKPMGMQPGMHHAAGDAAMSLHHMHMLANHSVEMAAAGANLKMIGAMGMAPGVDAMGAGHGQSMLDEAAGMLDELLEGDAMRALHDKGATPEADGEMNYTHLIVHDAKGVIEVLRRMPAATDPGASTAAADMTMHHMHVMIGHALEMASQGSTLIMIGQMNMAPEIDGQGIGHGQRMLAEARGMVAGMMSGPAMMRLHQQGMDGKASALMAYTHELGRVAMAHIDLLGRMSPAGGGMPMQHKGGGHEMHHKGGGHEMRHGGEREMHHKGGEHEMHHGGGEPMHR